jgi:hypothetical protein
MNIENANIMDTIETIDKKVMKIILRNLLNPTFINLVHFTRTLKARYPDKQEISSQTREKIRLLIFKIITFKVLY